MSTTTTLPTDVILKEILPRCAARSLLRFKCVCKSFNALISSPEFNTLHLQHCLTYNPNRLLILKFQDSISCFDLDSSNNSPKFFSLRLMEGLVMVGSCNGLLCMMKQLHFWLINPCTGMSLEIPPSTEFISEFRREHNNNVTIDGNVNFGFGYDALNHDFKIVVLVNHGIQDDHGLYGNYFPILNNRVTFVYSFKANSWKLLKSRLSIPYGMICNLYGVLTNNHLLHWMIWCSNYETLRICCFDLHTEEWIQDVPLPDYRGNSVDGHFYVSKYLVHIGVFDKCLYLLSRGQNERAVEVWVMKEYGVKESWVKLLGVSDSNILTKDIKFYPLAYRGSTKNEILVRRFDTGLEFVWYKISDKTYQIVFPIERTDRTIFKSIGLHRNALICDESLVALPGGEQIFK